MKDLSVLTPPLLVCLAVLAAIGAFLRHEMGGKRDDSAEPPDETLPEPPFPGQSADSGAEARDAAGGADEK